MNPLEPAPTPLDLRWRLFGVPCRVHPTFWFFGLILGMVGAPQTGIPTYIGIWMVALFVSVYLHELGHAGMARAFGEHSSILLYSMGGFAMGYYQRLERWQRILVSAAGPLADFLLLWLVVLFDNAYWNHLFGSFGLDLPFLRTPWSVMGQVAPNYIIDHTWYRYLIGDLVIMNLFWALLNLIPVIPLDGGNILREVCTGVAPRSGLRLALGLSFVIAGAVAFYSFLKYQRPELPYPPLGPMFNIVIFGMLAFQNFALLRAAEQDQRRWDHYGD